MKFFLVLAAVVIDGQAISTPQVPAEQISTGLQDNRSLLSSLLQVTGYSDTCVAAALDTCNTSHTTQADTHHGFLLHEARQVLEQVSVAVNKWESQPRHCKDLLDSGDSGSGLRQVFPYPGRPHHRVSVFCDHTVDGGGWTVLQRRTNDTQRQDFYRTFIEYQLGFGDLRGEFWLGLDLMHQLTSTSLQQLRIDLADYEGGRRWAKYGVFHVAGAEDKFRLNVGRFRGNVADGMEFSNGADFSTHDSDNDKGIHNCAKKYKGGFWYKLDLCYNANLNGFHYQGNYFSSADGITWKEFRGWQYSLRKTSMMIRPAF